MGSSKQQLPLPVAVDTLTQALLGLQHLHKNGIVHRDFRADNLLIHAKDPWMVKVTDFGIARRLSNAVTGKTHVDGVGGPLRWLAPEALCDEDSKRTASFATDMYMVGGLLFELLTCGQYPFYWVSDDALTAHRYTDAGKNCLASARARGVTLTPWRISDESPASSTCSLSTLERLMELCLRADASKRPSLGDALAVVGGDDSVLSRLVPSSYE